MIERDPFFFWRIAPEISVTNAAVLMIGGDPSDQVTYSESQFLAASSALKAAISTGELPAKLKHRAEDYYETELDDIFYPHGKFLFVSPEDIRTLLPSPDGAPKSRYGTLAIEIEPDWSVSTVKMTDLRAWLQSRGISEGALFPSEEPASTLFMDPAHDHFSPELALAVAAWRALASDQRTNRSPKQAIETWIDAHPEAWKGDGVLSGSAKERVVTIVNWRKTGGAPTTGS